MKSFLRPAAVLLALAGLATGLGYPLLVTGIAQVLWPHPANGSQLERKGVVVGSALVGQSFVGPGWFHGRPSATAVPYDGAASSGSNLAPGHPALVARVAAELARLRGPGGEPVPIDLVTTSASGLDPHLSPEAAYFQVPRVASERGWPVGRVRELVGELVERRSVGILGEPRVSVLRLNLALDALVAHRGGAGG